MEGRICATAGGDLTRLLQLLAYTAGHQDLRSKKQVIPTTLMYRARAKCHLFQIWWTNCRERERGSVGPVTFVYFNPKEPQMSHKALLLGMQKVLSSVPGMKRISKWQCAEKDFCLRLCGEPPPVWMVGQHGPAIWFCTNFTCSSLIVYPTSILDRLVLRFMKLISAILFPLAADLSIFRILWWLSRLEARNRKLPCLLLVEINLPCLNC